MAYQNKRTCLIFRPSWVSSVPMFSLSPSASCRNDANPAAGIWSGSNWHATPPACKSAFEAKKPFKIIRRDCLLMSAAADSLGATLWVLSIQQQALEKGHQRISNSQLTQIKDTCCVLIIAVFLLQKRRGYVIWRNASWKHQNLLARFFSRFELFPSLFFYCSI